MKKFCFNYIRGGDEKVDKPMITSIVLDYFWTIGTLDLVHYDVLIFLNKKRFIPLV